METVRVPAGEADRAEGGRMISLAKLVADFATAIQQADACRPHAVGSRTGRPYQAGIGPHTEGQTIGLVMHELLRGRFAS
jgi:hypothetical protein